MPTLMKEYLREGEIILGCPIESAAAQLACMHAGEATEAVAGQFKAGILHAQRAEQVLLEICLERLAADRFDRLADPIDADAVVPFVAGIECQRRRQSDIQAGDDPW